MVKIKKRARAVLMTVYRSEKMRTLTAARFRSDMQRRAYVAPGVFGDIHLQASASKWYMARQCG